MPRTSIQVIHDEHAALAAMLRSLLMMVDRGPGEEPEAYFDVIRAMLFYIDEFPARNFHEVEEFRMLFKRKSDIEMIDALALRNIADLGKRAKQRQSTVANMVAGRTI